MNEILIFFNSMEKLTERYPEIYFNVSRLRKTGRWRIQVMGKNQALKGDSELLCIEECERDEAFSNALKRLDTINSQIKSLEENPRKGM